MRLSGRTGFCVVLVLTSFVSISTSQLLFLMEPPPRLDFSNSTGARISCAAHGSPTPTISWLTEEGAPVTEIPGLRSVLVNGTLWLHAFPGTQYRSDVHATTYRCRAASTVGTILSRDMRIAAVMDTPWDVRVQSSHGVAGGAALLTCVVPSALKAHLSVARWLKDETPLDSITAESDGRYIVGGTRGDMLVVRHLQPGDQTSYSCEAQHHLTGQNRRSPSIILKITHSSGSVAPRMLTVSEDELVQEGADVRLVCCAVGIPPPTYSWFRHNNGRLNPVASSIRVSVSEEVLIIRRAQLSDSGTWTCRAHNQYGEQRKDTRLRVRARLGVSIQPQLQVTNSGSSAVFNCSVTGEDARIRWLHDGVPVGGGERVLRVHGVARAHRGMYQCFAERDLDSAQAAAELRLGDTVPELQYTFIEQALHPGPALVLHCAASGTPPPRFTWLIDMQPIEEHNTPQRTITQFMNSVGDVVSYLNITSVRPEDGGRYTCRAHNARGATEHSTRLNVYGPPSIRSIGPLRVVAGVNTTIFCPYSGFPISEIQWLRNGRPVIGVGDRMLATPGGELLLWPADPSDAGVFTCRVTAPSMQYAQKDIQIFVRNPPRISGFNFPADLVEGSSVQILCGITSGDKPVYFSWLKDGHQVPTNLQIQEKSLDEFSFLIFSHVTSKHSGEYTCVASNSAAEVNHTARLAVKVAPSWVYEPQDVSALLGTQIIAHCVTRGYPEPKVIWLKAHDSSSSTDFRPVSNVDVQFSILPNGSLSIASVAHHHEGKYMCRAENGIGRPLSKIIKVSINEPAHFEYSSRNMTAKRTAQVTLECDARGDPPIQLQWTHNINRVDLSTYRLSISEKRSENGVSSHLNIAHSERHDSGVYRCRAENAYGEDELLIYLAIQEFPEAPRGLQVLNIDGRSATITWRRGYDGNAPLRLFRVQYRVVGAVQTPRGDDWLDAPTRDLPPDRITERHEFSSTDTSSDTILEYRLEGLRPATAYSLRLSAVNAIGESDYSDSVIIHTLEEAPSDPPHNVQVQAISAAELLVKWQAPPQDSWNGEVLGYLVTWQEVSAAQDTTQALSLRGWGASSATLAPLRARQHYTVRVHAFNSVGLGPACSPLTHATLEGVPEASPQRVRCEPSSTQSIQLWWEAPPADTHGGNLLGYDLIYGSVDDIEAQVETRRAGGTETVLQNLQRATNYSVVVRARTAAGAGPVSSPVYCSTREETPGPPADIKVCAASEDAVVVSWLPPAGSRDGRIKRYTLYHRLQRTSQHSRVSVDHKENEDEYQMPINNLKEHQLYEFWVTAATASGEGEMSSVLVGKPNARAPARVTSFGGVVRRAKGSAVHLWCRSVGTPTPHTLWTRTRTRVLPLLTDTNLEIQRDRIIIRELENSTEDNYTCVVRNPWGEDRVRWEVRLMTPPPSPQLRLTASSITLLHLVWDVPTSHRQPPVHSYTLKYSRADDATVHELRLSSDIHSYKLERLKCGTMYRIILTAQNAVGSSDPSDELVLSTKGGPSKPPDEKNMIVTNKTCVRVNMLTWDSNGCPMRQLYVSVKSFGESSWRSQTVTLDTQPTVFCGLLVATWYHLKIVATNDAGATLRTYYFSTLNEHGEKIPVPAQFPPENTSSNGTALLAIAGCALISALLLLTFFAWKRRSRVSNACFRKDYEQQGISGAEHIKCADKHENKRKCQQVYTSSPIKHVNKNEQQEMYEISPYATFSMSGHEEGAGAGAAAGSGVPCAPGVTLRTFGRADGTARAPPTRRKRHCLADQDSLRSVAVDEYTMSRAMTLVVRGDAGSESDSSDCHSPCAECSPTVAYRMPLATKEEVFRSITDSSAESVGSARASTSTALGTKLVHRDRQTRRRLKKHHTPPGTRYHQCQDQERRDFTIHV